MNDPDEAWVKKAQKGDREAFGKLVSQYYEMVYVVSYGVVRNREQARDTAQDVFLKVFRDIRKFEGKSKFKTWLYRVATNAAIDLTRKRRPQQSLDATDASAEDGEAPVIIPDEAPSPRDEASRRDLRRLLDEAIEKLPPEHRAVLVLREWKEMSYEEIAETLEIQIGTVMSRLHYARKKLAEILGHDFEESRQ